MSFLAKGVQALDRQLKVQRLTIPFTVTFSATAANVVLANDEPSVLFLQSQGIDQITAADSVAAAAYADTTPTDSSGQLNILVKVGESVAKVMQARMRNRVTGVEYTVYQDTGGTNGVSTTGNMMLYVATAVNFTTTSLNACLSIDYSVSDGN